MTFSFPTDSLSLRTHVKNPEKQKYCNKYASEYRGTEMDNEGDPTSTWSIPPVGHRAVLADTMAPDGSEIRLLIGHIQGRGTGQPGRG